MYKFLCYLSLFFIFSCSSEKPDKVVSQKPSEAAKPGVSISEVYSLEIKPTDVSRKSTLYLVSNGFNLSDAKIVWLVNNMPVISSSPGQFSATETRKGDIVQAKASIKGTEILSNSIKIKNALPEIGKIKILPEVFKPGDTLNVNVVGRDLDGDAVTFVYEWTKNREPAGKGQRIEVPVKRGDKIDIKITPFDGENYGRPIILHREIGNLPPVIVDSKIFDFDGKVYTYQVKAIDPDSDPLTYSLKKAPKNMTIDKSTGIINWNVPLDFKGKEAFTVSVTDGHGGEAVQDFNFAITSEN